MRAVPLDARPCRPGELPHRFRIVCERALILDVVTQAARDGIPVELWVRIAVEAARVRDGIVAVSGLPHALVQDQLDTAASEPLREVVGCGELGLYARLLRDRAPSRPTRAAPGDNLSVRVSRHDPLCLAGRCCRRWPDAGRVGYGPASACAGSRHRLGGGRRLVWTRTG